MAVANRLAPRTQKTGLTAYLTQDAVKDQINKVVGGKNGTRFISSIVSAVQATPALQGMHKFQHPVSGTSGRVIKPPPSPQLGQYYMVPYDNRSKGRQRSTVPAWI